MQPGERPRHAGTDAGYRRRVLAMLSTATFFEGYDGFVLPYVLSAVLATFHASVRTAGVVGAIGRTGSVVAFFLAAQADRLGRRRLLLITVAGYTLATLLTAVAPVLALFAGAQFAAQVFLGAEYGVALTIVAEEFPAARRGRALGILTSMSTLGAITVGILGFAGLQGVPFLHWRAFYLVGVLPLVLVGMARRGMRETEMFSTLGRDGRGPRSRRGRLFEPWRGRLRGRLLAIGLVHFFRMLGASAAIFWFAYYAEHEVGVSTRIAGLYVAGGGVAGAGGFIVAGRAMDRWGRRPTLLVYEAVGAAFGAWLFQIHRGLALVPPLVVAIFFGLGGGAVTGALATEPFPTNIRGRAAAWSRNAFEIPGSLLGPLLVGYLGDPRTGPIGSIGDAATIIIGASAVPVLFLVWRHIPELRGQAIE